MESFLSHGGRLLQDDEEGDIFRIAINAAANRDPAALCALEEYTDCVAVGLLNCINLIDIHKIVLGYRCNNNGLVEKMIQRKIEQRLLVRNTKKVVKGEVPIEAKRYAKELMEEVNTDPEAHGKKPFSAQQA